MRLYLAFVCFFRVLFGKPLPDEVLPPMPAPPALEPPRPAEQKMLKDKTLPVEGSGGAMAAAVAAADQRKASENGALQLLGLLQREGRFVDFLRESVDGYDDATVGAAARDIHRGCRKALEEHFSFEAAMGGAEGDKVSIAVGFDAARVRLIGNVNGQPPFSGTLRHHGWVVTKVKLPQAAAKVDHQIVAPAEVEVA